MKFTIYGKNMHVSEGLKDILKKKFQKFDRYFDKETEIYATFSKDKNGQMLEVTIPLGKTILRAEEWSDDMKSSIEAVVDKLEGQLRKYKTKLQKRYANEAPKLIFDAFEDEEDAESVDVPKVVELKNLPLNPCRWTKRRCRWICSNTTSLSFSMRKPMTSTWCTAVMTVTSVSLNRRFNVR